MSARWLGRFGSMCWAMTMGAAKSPGSVASKVESASMPPAEEPITTSWSNVLLAEDITLASHCGASHPHGLWGSAHPPQLPRPAHFLHYTRRLSTCAVLPKSMRCTSGMARLHPTFIHPLPSDWSLAHLARSMLNTPEIS